MTFDPNTLMHNGTWLSVFGVLAVFLVFYIARSTIQFIYSIWPIGKIKALREAPKTVDKWQIALPNSHLHARAQVVLRLNEATDELAKKIIQTKLSGVAATIALHLAVTLRRLVDSYLSNLKLAGSISDALTISFRIANLA